MHGDADHAHECFCVCVSESVYKGLLKGASLCVQGTYIAKANLRPSEDVISGF